MHLRLLGLLLIRLPFIAVAQFVPYHGASSNLTVVQSPADPSVTISYKQPRGVCSTAFDTQQQYTGWVNIPGAYQTNLFFWFVGARQPTSALTIWLTGGPGTSSLYAFFTGNGPCEVVESGLNQYDTVARDWGWDRASNMLFIDQPNQVGFSFDTPTNGTANLVNGTYSVPPRPGMTEPGETWQVINGTFPSLEANQTANTTEIASMAVWHLLQGFFGAFPQYRSNRSSVGVNLFSESYGGRYGPIFAETFQEQNQKRLTGVIPRNKTIEINLVSLGIVNGLVDSSTQVPFYPVFANDNTYGFEAISGTEAALYSAQFSEKGGCQDLINQCTTVAAADDPSGAGNVSSVNDVCVQALRQCNAISQPYYSSGRNAYDIAAPSANPFPPSTFLDYLNQAAVQQALGSPVNFTMTSYTVLANFDSTGDEERGGDIQLLATLLNAGVRVGLIYGDRDYICNWLGGEAVSKSIALQAGGAYAANFSEAGYAPIVVNDSYIGGVVRQFGNLSFSRVYQAGHSVASYQPETAFQLFARIIMGISISTGAAVDLSTFGSSGAANATQKDKLPPLPDPTCYVQAFGTTCDQDAYDMALNGDGVVINGVLYASSADWPLMTVTTTTSMPASIVPATLTGIFTATGTPKGDAARSSPAAGLSWYLLWTVLLPALCMA